LAPISAGDWQGPSCWGNPGMPGSAVRMQCRVAWQQRCAPLTRTQLDLTGVVGELVLYRTATRVDAGFTFESDEEEPLPKLSYIEHLMAGIWRHGDWIEIKSNSGGSVIYAALTHDQPQRSAPCSAEIYQAGRRRLDEVDGQPSSILEFLGRESLCRLSSCGQKASALHDT